MSTYKKLPRISEGTYSESIFDRKKLPERVILLSGTYIPRRIKTLKTCFDEFKFYRKNWVSYGYGKINGEEFLVVTNIYGGAMMLETLQILRDGRARKVFFIGSAGGKEQEIGTIIIPERVLDYAGIVQLIKNKREISQEKKRVKEIERELRRINHPYEKGVVISVPAVLHDEKELIKKFESDSSIRAVELELSTFIYFSKKWFKSYAAIYISDNQEKHLLEEERAITRKRLKAIRILGRIATRLLLEE